MILAQAQVELVTPVDEKKALELLECCGRVCYKSEGSIEPGTAGPFVRRIIDRGHESVLEHVGFTARFVVDRGVSHEIVRHRLASYSQESTRYCNYQKSSFGGEITVIEPCYLGRDSRKWELWYEACLVAEQTYFHLLRCGCTPQEARAVLPHSLKTEVVMTANLREWRHFLRLRTSKAAHPQMREVAVPLLDKLHACAPTLFGDIKKGD